MSGPVPGVGRHISVVTRLQGRCSLVNEALENRPLECPQPISTRSKATPAVGELQSIQCRARLASLGLGRRRAKRLVEHLDQSRAIIAVGLVLIELYELLDLLPDRHLGFLLARNDQVATFGLRVE
jgi:hypothetical protein